MAYRTQRAFRAQYGLLVAASMLEEASARLDGPAGVLARPFRGRLEREVERRRTVLAGQLQEFRLETLERLAPSDLLPAVDALVRSHAEFELDIPETGELAAARRLTRARLGTASIYVATAAWAATAAELLTRGITNRPSLVVAELTALALTPLAIFQSPKRDRSDRTDAASSAASDGAAGRQA